MKTESRPRNRLFQRIQHLSVDKLNEVDNLLKQIENQFKTTESTLSLAGSWKDLDPEILLDFTTRLHENRAKDSRNISL